MARNSFLTVVDEAERFLGLYRAEWWFAEDTPHEPIADDFEPFSEDHVIGADASIVDFLMTDLVVSGGCKLHICGGRKLHTRHPVLCQNSALLK